MLYAGNLKELYTHGNGYQSSSVQCGYTEAKACGKE